MPSESQGASAPPWHRSWRTAAGLGALPFLLAFASGLAIPFGDAFDVFVGIGMLALPLGVAAIVVGVRAREDVAEAWRWAGPVALGVAACGLTLLMVYTLASLGNLSNLENLSNLSNL